MSRATVTGCRKGFTLVELAVVIVIIGVLAAFGVPQFLKSVERSKAAEAFNYLSAVRSAQERYVAKEGKYASQGTDLDINQVLPKYFSTGAITATAGSAGAPIWYMTLTRKTETSSYGGYTVTFSEQGFVTGSSTITSGACSDINPMGN